jgi:hypothetical protein
MCNISVNLFLFWTKRKKEREKERKREREKERKRERRSTIFTLLLSMCVFRPIVLKHKKPHQYRHL